MGIIGTHKLTKNALKCWYLRWLLAFLFLLAIEIFTVLVANNLLYGLALYIIRYTALSMPILFAFFLIFAPYLKFINFSYHIGSEELLIFSGFIAKKKQIISTNNIQHIELRAYPFERLYKLTTVKIYTSGSEHILPSVPINHASQIQAILYRGSS